MGNGTKSQRMGHKARGTRHEAQSRKALTGPGTVVLSAEDRTTESSGCWCRCHRLSTHGTGWTQSALLGG